MEDGIERHMSMLLESEKMVQRANNEQSRSYIHLPDKDGSSNINRVLENIVVTDDIEKILDVSKKKNDQNIVFADKPAPYKFLTLNN